VRVGEQLLRVTVGPRRAPLLGHRGGAIGVDVADGEQLRPRVALVGLQMAAGDAAGTDDADLDLLHEYSFDDLGRVAAMARRLRPPDRCAWRWRCPGCNRSGSPRDPRTRSRRSRRSRIP